jgi:hypothetical protein
MTSWARYLAYFGGVGNGKTTAGVTKTIEICKHFPKSRGVIARKTWPALESTTMEEFFEICPPELIDWKQTRKSAGSPQCKFKNGSTILFRHLDDKGSSNSSTASTVYQRLSNLNLNFVFIDQAEEVSEQWYRLFSTRLRRKVYDASGRQCPHQLMLVGNMAGHNGIWRQFVNEEIYNHCIIVASTLENQANLPAEYVADLLSAPKSWVERYVYGSWEDYTGLIFGELRKRIHEVEPFEIPPNWRKFRVIDHGRVNPGAAEFWAVDNDDNCFLFNEHYERDWTVRKHVRKLMNMSEPYGKFKRTWYDPSVFYRTRQQEVEGKRRLYDAYLDEMKRYTNERPELKPFGLWGYPANNDFRAGVDRVEAYATFDENHTNPLTGKLGSPRMFIFKGMNNFWAEQGDYTWKPPKGGVDITDAVDALEEEDDSKPNHLMDCTRYFLLTRPAIRYADMSMKVRKKQDAWKSKWREGKKNWKTA